MSEGWKEQIKLSVGYDPGYRDIEEVHSEIDRVYAQAAKTEEYEAKAKLADELISELKDSSYYNNTVTKDLMISMCLTKIKKYESGE